MQGPWTMVWEAWRYLAERWRDERSPSSVGFDADLGVRTAAWTLGGYEPTPPEVFDELMDALPAPVGGATFVDVGAGKGRVLLMAARYPFARVLGLELDEGLVAQAQRNLRGAHDPARRVADVSVLHADATDCAWPLGPLVVFLYNPFPEADVAALVDRLNGTLEKHPRPCTVAYLNPRYGDAFVERGWHVAAEGGAGVRRWVWLAPVRAARG